MASKHEPPSKTLSKVIDEIEEIRERLLGLQRDLEKMERLNLGQAPGRSQKKTLDSSLAPPIG